MLVVIGETDRIIYLVSAPKLSNQAPQFLVIRAQWDLTTMTSPTKRKAAFKCLVRPLYVRSGLDSSQPICPRRSLLVGRTPFSYEGEGSEARVPEMLQKGIWIPRLSP